MLRTGVIAVTNPGHVAARGFVANALANNTSCAGFAVHDGEKLLISRILRPDDKTINGVFDGLKDHRVNLHLGNYPDQFPSDDMQPFVLVGDDKTPCVAVMLDGDWASPAPEGSNHSDEFFVALNHLRPMFQQLFKLTKGDVNAMIEEVDGDATRNSIQNLFINRGSVHLMFDNGQVRTIFKNDLAMEYPFGWVSNHFGYTEDKVPSEKPNILSGLLGGKAVQTEAVAGPKIVLPPAKSKEPETVLAADTGPKMVTCPREIKKPHKVESYYRHNAGYAPPNYMEYPTIEARPKDAVGPTSKVPVVKDLKDLGTAVRETATRVLPDVGSTKEDIARRTPPKVAGPKIVAPVEPIKQPEKVAEPAKIVVPPTKKEAVASMTPETQRALVDNWLKSTAGMVTITDRSGNPIIDPKDAVAMEEKRATFAERLGIKLEDTFTWKVERMEKLLYEHPDAALHLLCDYRQNLAATLKALASATTTERKIILPPSVRKAG